MKNLLISILNVFLALVISILVVQVFQIILGNKVSFEEFIYTLVFTEIGYIVPFFIFFLIYKVIRDYLLKRDMIFSKINNQFLLGIGLMIMCIVMITIITMIIRGLSLSETLAYMLNLIVFVVFVPVVILLDYLFRKRLIR